MFDSDAKLNRGHAFSAFTRTPDQIGAQIDTNRENEALTDPAVTGAFLTS